MDSNGHNYYNGHVWVSSLPTEGEANSTAVLRNPDGSVKQERSYGPDGKVTEDTDYNHPGNKHQFPHKHKWKDGVRGPAEPCPTPSPSQFSWRQPVSYNNVVADTATAVGVGTIIYWVISEGSRIVFPPRNLVPVP